MKIRSWNIEQVFTARTGEVVRTKESDLHSDNGAKGIAPIPMPTTNAPVVATPATSLPPSSARAPAAAALETDDANVKLIVKIPSWKTSHALYPKDQFWGFSGSEGEKPT